MPRMLASLPACLLLLSLAGVSQPLLAQQPVPRRLEISLNNGQADINRVRPTIPGPRHELELALGAPDRILPEDQFFKDGHVLKWDQLGLYGLQDYRKTTVSGLGIVLSMEDGKKSSTKEIFPGTLTIDGATVTSQSTIEQINKAKRGAPFTKIDPTLYTLDFEKVVVRIRLTDPKVAPKGVHIVRIILMTPEGD